MALDLVGVTALSPTALATLHREADRIALRIVHACRRPRHEREDLRQDLPADLLARLRHFDPARGSFGAFAATCFAHHAARLTERLLRGRATMAPISLDDPLPGAEALTLADVLAAEDGFEAWVGQPTDAIAALERRLDLDRALSAPASRAARSGRLSIPQRTACSRRVAKHE